MSNPNIASAGLPEHNQSKRNTRFKPGTSGNPKGRPSTRFISEALKNRLEAGDAEVLGDRALKIAKQGKPSQSVAALTFIADRTEGKPVQAHRIEHAIDGETAKVLSELAKQLL